MVRINGNAIDMSGLIKDIAPALPAVTSRVKPAEALLSLNGLGPTGQIHMSWIARVKRQIVRRVHSCRKSDLLPVFRRIRRFVKSAVNLFAIFQTPRNEQIQRAVKHQHEPPRIEIAPDAAVLEFPGAAIIVRLEDTFAESRNIERSASGGTLRIEYQVGRDGIFRHTVIRLLPCSQAVSGTTD